jgi:hypothetical protein
VLRAYGDDISDAHILGTVSDSAVVSTRGAGVFRFRGTRDHLAASNWISYIDDKLTPGELVRKWPDEREPDFTMATHRHKSLILKGNSCIIRVITNLCRRLKMKRKNGFLKRAKSRKSPAADGGHATLTAFRLLQSLKNAVRVACPPVLVNIYSTV